MLVSKDHGASLEVVHIHIKHSQRENSRSGQHNTNRTRNYTPDLLSNFLSQWKEGWRLHLHSTNSTSISQKEKDDVECSETLRISRSVLQKSHGNFQQMISIERLQVPLRWFHLSPYCTSSFRRIHFTMACFRWKNWKRMTQVIIFKQQSCSYDQQKWFFLQWDIFLHLLRIRYWSLVRNSYLFKKELPISLDCPCSY